MLTKIFFFTILLVKSLSLILNGNEINKHQNDERFKNYIKNIETADLPLQIKPWDLYKFREQKNTSLPMDTAFSENYETPYKKIEYRNNIILITYIVPSDPIQLVLKNI